ncbi:restriction endonuclease subunit S [Paenibacillus sp. BAC0078]
MRTVRIEDIFEVRYGVNLELNRLEIVKDGIPFVSRTAKNNGVSARVKLINAVKPIEAGVLTVAGGGSVLETFLQPEPFYSGRDLYYLKPRFDLTIQQKLYYCLCIRANKFRYNYGRQANRTLKDIQIPAIEAIPEWVLKTPVKDLSDLKRPFHDNDTVFLKTAETWDWFELEELFELKKGKRLTKANMTVGTTPFVGAVSVNNGLTRRIGQDPIHPGNTITVNYNGAGVADAFYQPEPFWCSDDVNVLYPKFNLTPQIALFINTILKKEKYRFSYGRKWHLERMRKSRIKLPVDKNGDPDWTYMQEYIKSLPFSSNIPG